jgi:hypothetical protein
MKIVGSRFTDAIQTREVSVKIRIVIIVGFL